MECYFCKAKISRGMRMLLHAKNKREITKFRDVCLICYPEEMNRQGYTLVSGIWVQP